MIYGILIPYLDSKFHGIKGTLRCYDFRKNRKTEKIEKMKKIRESKFFNFFSFSFFFWKSQHLRVPLIFGMAIRHGQMASRLKSGPDFVHLLTRLWSVPDISLDWVWTKYNFGEKLCPESYQTFIWYSSGPESYQKFIWYESGPNLSFNKIFVQTRSRLISGTNLS